MAARRKKYFFFSNLLHIFLHTQTHTLKKIFSSSFCVCVLLNFLSTLLYKTFVRLCVYMCLSVCPSCAAAALYILLPFSAVSSLFFLFYKWIFSLLQNFFLFFFFVSMPIYIFFTSHNTCAHFCLVLIIYSLFYLLFLNFCVF